MSLKRFKQSKYVTYHDLPENGLVATIVSGKTEMLEDFRTKQPTEFIVLEFAECKPLVCKNPVVDALSDAFPEVNSPHELVGKRILLVRSDERIAGEVLNLVRVDALGTARLQGMQNASQPNAGATISDRPPTPVHTEPAHMRETPPPPTDEQIRSAFPDALEDDQVGF